MSQQNECSGGETCFRVPTGHKAPLFELEGVIKGDFKKYRLADNIQNKRWTVLFWYPLDFTFVCPTEIAGFGSELGAFNQAGAEVWGVSTDSKFSHKAWLESNDKIKSIGYPLLADFTKETTRKYGILKEDLGAGYRGTFIIDPEGVVRSCVVNDLPVGRSISETLRTLQALQTGELCQVDWKPGTKTLSSK